MEPAVEKAFEIANIMATLNNQKRVLKEEHEQTLYYFYNGGTFRASNDLISYLAALKQLGMDQNPTITDYNNIPIYIESLDQFTQAVIDCHVRANNLYHAKYQELKKNRSVKGILEK